MQMQQKMYIRIGEQAWELLHSEQRMGESYEKAIIRSLSELKSHRIDQLHQPIHVVKTTAKVEPYQPVHVAKTAASVDPDPEPLIVEEDEEEDEGDSEDE